jgi:hypothetical protein
MPLAREATDKLLDKINTVLSMDTMLFDFLEDP